jgi:dihydroneopterin aldolase
MDRVSPFDSVRTLRHVLIRDLVLLASIGVYAQEHGVKQRIRLNVDLGVTDDTVSPDGTPRPGNPVGADELERVVDYAALVQKLREVIAVGHVRLVETLAERLAVTCLEDPRVQLARIRIEKLDVLPDGASAGVEIERRQIT